MATVTIRDIARHTGLSKSTIAGALKGDLRYSEKTISKVKKAAEELGYCPNPLVTAGMMRIRDAKHFDSEHSTMGYLSDLPWSSLIDEKQKSSGQVDVRSRMGYIGAKERARELGFGIDYIEYSQPHMTTTRLRNIIKTRGILGFIIAPHQKPQVELDLQWEEFAVVCIGFSVQTPRFDRVGFDHHEAIIEVCNQMWQKGKRRLGLVMSADYDARVSYVTRAGFLRWQADLKGSGVSIPVSVGQNENELKAWYDTYQPDCIIAQGEAIHDALIDLNLEQIDVSLVLTPEYESHGGFDMSLKTLASSAVDMLAGKLYRNEYGLPQNRQSVLVLGSWNEPVAIKT